MMKYNLFSRLLVVALFFAGCAKDGKGPDENGNQNDTSSPVLYREGITRISADSLAFVLFAPGKTEVHLIGDFNNWTVSTDYQMQKDGNFFRISIGGLDPGKEYVCQYLIDNKIRIADPYSNKISDPIYDAQIPSEIYPNIIAYPTGKTTEIAMVVGTAIDNYPWKVEAFTPAEISNLVIYEILIRDFTEKRSIKGVQEKLPYLKSLGVNAIELMPFNEFEGNDSWGYNPSFYFATDKIYGTSNDYKEFIDVCHQNGVAVIMDMVLNHSYGQSPLVRMYQNANGTPSSANPWYHTTSPNQVYSWGYDFNHESVYTKQFVDSVCAFWMQEYKVDGFRFDFTKGFTNTPGDGWNYDPSRIEILKRMADEIWKRKKGALVILEHLTENTEEKELADYGMLLWGNLNYNVNEMTMGWGEEEGEYGFKGDISWASYRQRGWSKPHLIAYMESHDEERLMFKNNEWGKVYNGYDVKNLTTGLQRTAGATVLFFSLPGPKMIWQFGELGYDVSIDYNGRLGKKPIYWGYYDIPERKALFDVYAKMIDLRTKNNVFSATDFTIDFTNHFKTILLKSGGEAVLAMANFDVVEVTKNVRFDQTGVWRDYFTNHEITVTGPLHDVTLEAGEYRLYINEQ